MRAHDERSGSASTPRIALSRADQFAPRSQAERRQHVDLTDGGAPTPRPAAIRALAFAASLGPVQAPCSAPASSDGMIDLAGEEALIEYLARLQPVSARD